MSNRIAAGRLHRDLRPSLFDKTADELIEAVENPYSSGVSAAVGGLSNVETSPFSILAGCRATAATGKVVVLNAAYYTGGGVDGDILESLGRLKAQMSQLRDQTYCIRATQALSRPATVPRPTEIVAAKLRVRRISEIQASFGFPMAVLADVLAISRQALYKWLDASKDITLQESSRKRLAVVERLAKAWRQRCRTPLNSAAYGPLAGGGTVLDLLKGAEIVETVVTAAFEELIRSVSGKPKSLGRKLADAGFTRLPSARSLPSDE